MADNDDDYNETELRDKFKLETRVFDSNNMRDFDFDESDSDRKITKNDSSSSDEDSVNVAGKKFNSFRQNINPPSPDINFDDDDEDRFDSHRPKMRSNAGHFGQNRKMFKNDYDSTRNTTGGAYGEFRRKNRNNFRSGGGRYNDDNGHGSSRNYSDRLSGGRFGRHFDGGEENDYQPFGVRSRLGHGAGKAHFSSFSHRRKRNLSNSYINRSGDSSYPHDGLSHYNSLMVKSSTDNIDMARAFSFKEFVITLDDAVLPKEAVLKYNDYISNFSSKQLPQFFERIKHFESVKTKYHPVYKGLYFDFNRRSLLFRLNCFLALYLNGYLDGFSLDSYTTAMKNASLSSNCYISPVDVTDLDEEQKLLIEESVKSKLPDSSLLRIHYLLLIASNILLEMGSLEEVENAKNKIVEFVAAADAEETEIVESDDNDTDEEFDQENVKIKIKSNSSSVLSEPIVEGRHNVVSVFVKNIPHDISFDQVYKKYSDIDGFMRVYLPESFTWNKYFRRAYFTFKSGTNRNHILDDINSINFNELEEKKHIFSGIFVTNQTRHVLIKNSDSSYLINKSTLLHDARMVVSMIKALDARYKLYDSQYMFESHDVYLVKELPHPLAEVINGEKSEQELTKEEKNRKFVEDELFEKESVEFLDTLPEIKDFQFNHSQFPENRILIQLESILSETDPDAFQLKNALDLAIFYLRFIHSIDYYGLVEYPNEHMRNVRLSSLTLRPIQLPWANKEIEASTLKNKENLANYSEDVDEKFSIYLKPLELSDDEAKKLGEKSVENEIEAYIKKHINVTLPERCLCTLSNKKFKAFAYARKHILTNFKLALKKVEMDTIYQNNFMRDRLHKIPNPSGSSGFRNNTTDFSAATNLNAIAGSKRSQMYNPNGYSASKVTADNSNLMENRYRVDQSIDKIQRMITQYTDLDAPDFD